MYNSPIEIIYGQMKTQIEGDILKAVQECDIHVDKDELIRALQYDREQYDRGYADGYMNAEQELVRCKNCKHYNIYRLECHNGHMNGCVGIDGFCSNGERKDG